MKNITRAMISNPPIHAAHLVIEILSDESLRKEWFKETKHMADRIKSMRTSPTIPFISTLTNYTGTQLKKNIEDAGSHHDWSHITSQIGIPPPMISELIEGMFCFSGLTPEQVEKLKIEHHVYVTRDGRVSMAGINTGNVEYIAKAIVDVTKN